MLIPKTFDPQFQDWLDQHSFTEADRFALVENLKTFHNQPSFSLILPVCTVPADYLQAAIDSVVTQLYPNWDLCIVDQTSSDCPVKGISQEYAEQTDRIQVIQRSSQQGYAEAINWALAVATGEFVAVLHQDDLLAPNALYEMARTLNAHPSADLVYSDEALISEDNLLYEPSFKPDWSPDTLLSYPYTGQLAVYRRSLLTALGGIDPRYEEGALYDLVLRLTEKTTHIVHSPYLLYYRRAKGNAVTNQSRQCTTHLEQDYQALVAALERRGEAARVILYEGDTTYTVRYEVQSYDRVSIVIPTRDLAELLDRCLQSIFTKTTYSNYEVIVVDNGSVEPSTHALFTYWQTKEPDRFRCIPLDIPFNYPRLNNLAAQEATGKYLLFLNNDTEVITPDWVTAMVEQAQRSTIGAVGATLLYPDNTVQHAGVQVHSSPGNITFSHGYVKNWSAVTAACLMCRRSVFEEIGGFDEALAIAFNDVDLCFKMLEKGYYNVCLPHCVLYHYESKSRGQDDTAEKVSRCSKEIELLITRWLKYAQHDPYFSPHYVWKSYQPDFDYSLSVVVLWWDDIECLALWEHNMEHLTHTQVIFIDNGSQPEKANLLREFCNRHVITLIRNETALSFAAANNQGLAIATGTFILHLNSNLEIVDLPWAFLCAGAREGIAGFGPCLTESGTRYVAGWALCINRHTLQRLGGWREQESPGYRDDVELCDRATQLGYSITGVRALKDIMRPRWEDALPEGEPSDNVLVFEQVMEQLADVNLILFPDWQQPDDLLHESLVNAMRSVIAHPDLAQLTLLVYADDRDAADASLVIVGALMSLVVEDEIELEVEPQMVMIGALENSQWQRLSTRLTARVVLEMENQTAIAASGLETLSVYPMPIP